MQEKEFVALVDKLEVYVREHPAAYRLRVALLAALGYLSLFGVVALTLLILGIIIFFKTFNMVTLAILAVPLALSVVVVRSIWVEFPPPEGLELKHSDAPRLFDLVKKIQVRTNGPVVHKILLIHDFNAGIVQRPRLGVFGWQENYMTIGLPLLRALSKVDLRAVLAHEFGHLSGNHGKFSGWIYRVRQTWNQIMITVQQPGADNWGIFTRFFNWYAPYFAAYTFVLARAHEYEADRWSVTLVGKENAARALINVELKGRALSDDYWTPLYKRADKQPEPPADAYAGMLQSLLEPIAPNKTQLWFSESLTRRHGYDDTHPALGDRLESMGYTDVRKQADVNSFLSDRVEPRADQYFLTTLPPEFIEEMNRQWKEAVMEEWTGRFKFVAEAEPGLAALAEKASITDLSLDERWERAQLTAGTQGNIAAIPFLNDVLALMADHAAANYMLGEALLEQGNRLGIRHIEVAMKRDFEATPSGCETIYHFLMNCGQVKEAGKYRERICEYYEELELARQERNNVSTRDEFDSHGLPQEVLVALRAQLAEFPKLRSAHLVRKVVKHRPEDHSYVLGIISKFSLLKLHSAKHDQKLIDQLANELRFPGYTLVVAMENDYRGLRRKFKRIEGSLIYQS